MTEPSLAFDPSGNLYISDTNNLRLRKISATGIISTVAGNANFKFGGDGAAALSANLSTPQGVAIDAAGNLQQRTLLMILYGTGMRRAEVSRLKVTDVDSQRMIIRVECGKGGHDRRSPAQPGAVGNTP